MDKNGCYCILTKGGALSSYVESLAESAATYIPFAESRILWDTYLVLTYYMECGYMFTFLLIHRTFYFYFVLSISTSLFPLLPLLFFSYENSFCNFTTIVFLSCFFSSSFSILYLQSIYFPSSPDFLKFSDTCFQTNTVDKIKSAYCIICKNLYSMYSSSSL